ncbi:hypothetical protein GGP78_003165 [Salinibacter ruber]|uniref:HAD hydrolase family protein n=1 Tax=Salinibacter ruber TaxID=146919 RepID=UPI0021696120|nr:HAD hydrolase family protein [Salinibacter ruber]MCS3856462.1 hypothetical protein [Salinibacter ruber]
MEDEDISLDEVFGIQSSIPENYVSREGVDDTFVDVITRDNHVVIYGASKQGKTCLRKNCLDEDDYITVHCNNKWSLEDILSSILKKAGYKISISEKKSISGTQKIRASLGFEGFGIGGEGSETSTSEKTERHMELDPRDVNDIINALESIEFDKYIVLEDFHYLPEETQQDFAVSLKAFHEQSSFTFIVVGVWLEENRLILLNGDLIGRVVSVNSDEWNDQQLLEVIEKGESILNVRFEESFKTNLIENCFDSVYVVQEACRIACRSEDIWSRQEEQKTIGSDIDVENLVEEFVEMQEARYRSFLRDFSAGFQDTELEMYKWILYPIIKSETNRLEGGIRYSEIREMLESHHPRGEGLNPGNVTQALQSAASLQLKKDIKPMILDYDQTNRRLSVVDRGFLIWMSTQDQDELLRYIGLGDLAGEDQ